MPTADCEGKQAMAESRDNGLTWTVEEIPGSTTQDESDPHLGIGDKGTLYLGWQGGDGTDLGDKGYAGHARSEGRTWISVKPKGSTAWRAPVDVGASLGIQNIQFPEVFAGDDNRAAFAFLGTRRRGDDQAAGLPPASGTSTSPTPTTAADWTTVDATPTTRSSAAASGCRAAAATCRNLLDFNDVTVDKQGRVMVGYADGCTDKCVTATNYDYKGASARRSA